MRSVNSYQDILTPEEEEERENKRKLREIYEQEKAEYLADARRDEEHYDSEE